MVKLWVWRIQNGLNAIADVPMRWRDAVQAELDSVA